ncbi:hypothetical protein ZWY2020_045497 [Hordeum vulgare]|nr:hypothetical protein ZWY2020_045497 [Hordeum vulgare]
MAKTSTTKKAPVATDDGAGGKETTADVLAVISRLIGRPFLDETASKRLVKLGKMLATEAVLLHDADRRLLGGLAAEFREAEAAWTTWRTGTSGCRGSSWPTRARGGAW